MGSGYLASGRSPEFSYADLQRRQASIDDSFAYEGAAHTMVTANRLGQLRLVEEMRGLLRTLGDKNPIVEKLSEIQYLDS